MASLLSRVLNRDTSARMNETVPVTVYDWAKMYQAGSAVNYGGVSYQAYQTNGAAASFSGPVYACERWRVSVFSEARFAWQRIRGGRPVPGGLFGDPNLSVLEVPWPGATTRDLLAVAEIDVAQFGNSYWAIEDGYFVRFDGHDVKPITSGVIHPVTGNIIGERLEGYAILNKNRQEIAVYTPKELAHYKPIPSPSSQWIGASWISACMDDVESDRALTVHKKASIMNGSNITHVVSLDAELSPESFDNFVDKFNEAHQGPAMAGKTLFIQGGTDVKAVGQTFEQMALRATQGAGETRIASVSGVHPVIAGFSEGLGGSALNAGNYTAAKRNFVDGTIAPMWGAFCGAFGPLISAPGNDVRLWYDARDIPFLHEDQVAQANVMSQQASMINTLITAGFEPDAIINAVSSNDMSLLSGNHTGMYSVQLRPGGEAIDPVAADKNPPKPNTTPVPATASGAKAITSSNGKQPAKPAAGA